MDQAVQAVLLDNRRLEFDAERRAFHKLELKKIHQQQATDIPEPELMGKLEAKSGNVAALPCFFGHHQSACPTNQHLAKHQQCGSCTYQYSVCKYAEALCLPAVRCIICLSFTIMHTHAPRMACADLVHVVLQQSAQFTIPMSNSSIWAWQPSSTILSLSGYTWPMPCASKLRLWQCCGLRGGSRCCQATSFCSKGS